MLWNEKLFYFYYMSETNYMSQTKPQVNIARTPRIYLHNIKLRKIRNRYVPGDKYFSSSRGFFNAGSSGCQYGPKRFLRKYGKYIGWRGKR